MLIAEDLLLLLTDDATGKPVVDTNRLTLALTGAVLVELTLAGRIAVTDGGAWGSGPRVTVVSDAHLCDSVLDAALRKIASKSQPVTAQKVLSTLSYGLVKELRQRLVDRGILRAEEDRVLGVFPTRVWPAADARHEAQLRSALWEVVVVGRPPTDREITLVALLDAVDQVPKQFANDGMTARQLRERAKALSAGNLGGEAVKHAIAATTATLVATTTMMTSMLVATSS